MRPRRSLLVALSAALLATAPGTARAVDVPMDADHWNLLDAEIVTHGGRTCLAGVATVKDAAFENGVIEVDMMTPRARTYAGIDFRIQSPADCEQVYIRPHRAPFYPDALQYTPVFNGVAGWQIYNGEGFTSGLDLPYDEWVHLRLEILGTQARVFVNDGARPALRIHDLKHGAGSGSIGVNGRKDGNAFFSNFRYTPTDDLEFPPPPFEDSRPGTITAWEISQGFKLGRIDLERYPGEQDLGPIEWRRVTAEPGGVLDIARHVPRSGPGADCVLARTTLTADRDEIREFALGYSDAVVLFLNGDILFSGSSAYQQRDPSFLGVMGLFDSVYLPLRKGPNEVLLVVVESFGGWGLMARDGAGVFLDPRLEKIWETPDALLVPESAAYDPARDVYYVSNFGSGSPPGTQFLSKLGPRGEILEREWVAGLRSPLGMVISGDRLFVAQRAELLEIDVERASIAARHALPGAAFPNDVARDPDSGDLFVSDTQRNVIYRVHEGAAEPWLSEPEIREPNGLLVQNGLLYVCDNGDRMLKSVRLADRTCAPVASFREGILDGLGSDGRGGLLLSHWEGRLYRIDPAGRVTKLLDTSNQPVQCADILSRPDSRTVLVPTFRGNRVAAYRWTE
jgi:hypothetical protein